MLTDKEIEYFVFTLCNHCDKKKIQNIYIELQKKYNTDMEGLDFLYFDKEWGKISLLSLEELKFFIIKIKNILLEHFKGSNNSFYLSYFWILRWLISDLKSWEYWQLSNSFNKNIKIKEFIINELYDILENNFNDKIAIEWVIESLN